METAEDELGIDEVLDRTEESYDRVKRGIITGREGVDSLVKVFLDFSASEAGASDESEPVFALLRGTVEQIAYDRSVFDPVLVEYFEGEIRSRLLGAELSERLDVLLAEFRVRAKFEDTSVGAEVVDLAANGLESHPLLMTLNSATERILRTAHELRLPEALSAAVLPQSSHAHIADARRKPFEFRLALDLLAHLACEPGTEIGRCSVELLIDIASSVVDRCADAAARLPLHLLDENQRLRLLALHEARVDLFGEVNSVVVPVGIDTLRANRIVRTALWQAFDVWRVG